MARSLKARLRNTEGIVVHTIISALGEPEREGLLQVRGQPRTHSKTSLDKTEQ